MNTVAKASASDPITTLIKIKNNEYAIGYWLNERDMDTARYPYPIANSANDEQVLKMLDAINKIKAKATIRYYKGISMCRCCGCFNHSGEYLYNYKRGGSTAKYIVVPEGLEHYIKAHRVLVPPLLQINFK